MISNNCNNFSVDAGRLGKMDSPVHRTMRVVEVYPEQELSEDNEVRRKATKFK